MWGTSVPLFLTQAGTTNAGTLAHTQHLPVWGTSVPLLTQGRTPQMPTYWQTQQHLPLCRTQGVPGPGDQSPSLFPPPGATRLGCAHTLIPSSIGETQVSNPEMR
jgi:hypothetical protein